ncbi:MAG: polyprenyl synthetase family protein [Acidimicrobiaceae bacterium]|nr:polyprenyl synthetase family protein [Acidimicrobiaceae bacterium]MCY4280568.1 polyprenyl synthetase family protein [Acidimicrobiaceae bacterium]MCY4293364.1 polyprenyl synthetase family protein [Acidimicrobiaceae bacterium]
MAEGSPFALLPCLDDDLRRVQRELRAAAAAPDDFVSELARHLINVGGKLVRPGFCLASSLVREARPVRSSQAAVLGGVSVELVHIGSLYHDDVMDDATTRRSVVSVNAQWGNLRAILAGDYLLGRASAVAASLGAEVARLLAEAITGLCEGQIIELENAYDVERSEQRYERAVAGKTAALLSIACRIGATVGEVPASDVDALGEFGFAYGMAFQIVDDILDLVATESQLGKPAGNDLAEGTYTLPVIRALADPAAGEELRSILGGAVEERARDRAAELVRSTAGVDYARDRAREWADRAQAATSGLPDTPATAVLSLAADRLIETPALAYG